MRQRNLCSFFLLLLPLFSFAQFEYFNSEQFWNKLQLHRADETPDIHTTDTVIIVASNRVRDTSTFRYLPEKRDPGHIRYFVVYTGNGKWNVQPVSSLKQAVSLMPDKNKDWVVYTEGMGKFFTSDVDRGMSMTGQYDVNVIMFDYPSLTAHRKQTGNYFFAKKNATVAYNDFVPVLDTIQMMQNNHQLGTEGVNLFFHSMGNIVMQQIIKRGKLPQINETQWVNNLILNAACIPQRGHKKLLDQIKFAKNIYINYNPGDYTLAGAYFMSKRYQLGKQVRKPLSKKATYINFETIAGKGHSNFLNLTGRNEIPDAAFQYYNTILHGDTVAVHDTRHYQPTTYRGIGYDLLP
jgi:hypothetical protein